MSEEAHVDPHAFDSYWPFISAMGASVGMVGLVVHPAIFLAGLAILVYSVLGLAGHSTGLPRFQSRFQDMDPERHLLGRISTAKMGIWMFLVSEVLFFTGLIGTGIALRARADWWAEPGDVLNVPLTAANTFFLICSSMTMVEALRNAEIGNYGRMRLFLLGTLLIGLLFVSIQVVEYTQLIGEGFVPSESTYASTFYLQTGFHGGHVSGGLVAMAIVTWKAFKGQYDGQGRHETIELMGLYWHFVDVVWIFLFTIVYLI